MKRIETIIHARNWDQARRALGAQGVPATLREIKTFGRTPPSYGVHRGTRYAIEAKLELELTALVSDEQAETVVQVLLTANAGSEVWVSTVERFTRAEQQRPGPAMLRAFTTRAVPTPDRNAVAVHA